MEAKLLLAFAAVVALAAASSPLSHLELLPASRDQAAESINSNLCGPFGFDSDIACLFCSADDMLPLTTGKAHTGKYSRSAASCIKNMCDACGGDEACLTVLGVSLAPHCSRVQSKDNIEGAHINVHALVASRDKSGSEGSASGSGLAWSGLSGASGFMSGLSGASGFMSGLSGASGFSGETDVNSGIEIPTTHIPPTHAPHTTTGFGFTITRKRLGIQHLALSSLALV